MKISPFQAVVLAIFAVAIIAGVVVLATTKGKSSGNGAPVAIWGTMPSVVFNDAVSDLTQGRSGLKINYTEKRPENFDRDLVEALASGRGPDAVLLTQDLIVRFKDKILPLPYASISLPSFRDIYIQEAELYLDKAGIIGLPFSVDPLVMYWNRDTLSNAGYSLPPKSWDEFITLAPKLTVKDKNLNILKSAVALGEFRNINNAKEIIAALLMQTGNPIVVAGSNQLEGRLSPAALGTIGAVNFYTDFANPVKPDYAWNRALPNSLGMFVSGDMAFYFGFASEVSKIRDKNPNLNFDVALFPQPKDAPVAITFGRMQALSALKTSPNISGAFQVIVAIAGAGPAARLSKTTGLPPVRRAMLAPDPSDPYQSVFYNSAIRARAFLDPKPSDSSAIFQNMVESISSGEFEAGRAIDAAGQELNDLVRGL